MTYDDVIDFVIACSHWANIHQLEALAEEAFAAAVDEIEGDYCTPYGAGFGRVDMSAEVQS